MVRVLFVTAELAPLTRVGGLGEAAAGLVSELRAQGVDVELVLPDYSGTPLGGEAVQHLDVPTWVGPASARSGDCDRFGRVTLIDAPGLAKPHPYNDPASGEGWPDNTARFFAFSAAVAALADDLGPDVLHLNDWHTAPVLGMLRSPLRSMLTIHNLAYQGTDARSWLERLPGATDAYARGDACNPLAGAIALADRIVAVSPSYAREIVEPDGGFGLDEVLRARGPALSGILNGINSSSWDPSADRYLPAQYDVDRPDAKAASRAALLADLGWADAPGPLVAMVTRLAEQKGIDLALDTLPVLAGIGARLVLLGSGDRVLGNRARALAAAHPDVLAFIEDFNERLAHLIFAGADLLLMPSRFEPCGLTQMQAMAYGTIPIVTPVGGLLDTVVDDDHAGAGNGFVARDVSAPAVIEAAGRAIAAWRDPQRRRALIERGMRRDWSWRTPARSYRALYEELASTP